MYGRFGYSKKQKKSRLVFENDESALFRLHEAAVPCFVKGCEYPGKLTKGYHKTQLALGDIQGKKTMTTPKIPLDIIGSSFQRKAANIHRKNVCAKWAKKLIHFKYFDGSEILLTS